jgi:hypothetical protein
MVLAAGRFATLSREELIEKLLQTGAENAELKAEKRRLQDQVEARRTLKRRSPADWRFHVLRWEWGTQTFWPQAESQPKTVRNLRVHILLDDPNEGAPYWDITSKRLQAVLEPILPYLVRTGASVHVVKDGDGPTAGFSVSIEPP